MCSALFNLLFFLFCSVLCFVMISILVFLCFCFRLDVFVAGIACLLIGQPTYAAPPGLIQNSNTRRQQLPSLYEENEFDVNEFVPESSITEPDMTSSDARQKRDAGKKSRPENDGVDPCKPCHGHSEYLLKLLVENKAGHNFLYFFLSSLSLPNVNTQ